MNANDLLQATATAKPAAITRIGMTPWETVTPSVDALLGQGWTARQIFDWLRQQGIQIDTAQFRNFQVSCYRRKQRMLSPRKPQTKPSRKS